MTGDICSARRKLLPSPESASISERCRESMDPREVGCGDIRVQSNNCMEIGYVVNTIDCQVRYVDWAGVRGRDGT